MNNPIIQDFVNFTRLSGACKKPDDLITLLKTISDPKFKDFAHQSYRSKHGYSLRINPSTKKKEMFVAGTRSTGQWILNMWDLFLYSKGILDPTALTSKLDPIRKAKEKQLSKVASENNVDIIYGHSRGGALVADMPGLSPCIQRVGLDSAMLLARNKHMVNLNEGGTGILGAFDAMIGTTGKHNVSIDYSPYKPHSVWRV